MTDFVDQVVCPVQETSTGNLRNSEGALIELDDGRLLLAYTHFYRGAGDWDAGDIRGKISEDDGATWSEPFVVHPNTARCNSGRLALIRLPEHPAVLPDWEASASVLGLIYVDLNLFYDTRLYLTTSADEGQTWSRDLQINETGIPSVTSANEAIQRWFCPAVGSWYPCTLYSAVCVPASCTTATTRELPGCAVMARSL